MQKNGSCVFLRGSRRREHFGSCMMCSVVFILNCNWFLCAGSNAMCTGRVIIKNDATIKTITVKDVIAKSQETQLGMRCFIKGTRANASAILIGRKFKTI